MRMKTCALARAASCRETPCGRGVKAFAAVLIAVCTLAIVVGGGGEEEVSAETEGDWTYTISGSDATITGYSGTDAEITVPSTLGGYTVKDIADGVFKENKTLESVVLPEAVTRVGNKLFYECENLESVIISEKTERIGYEAFVRCALSEIILPDGIQEIGDEAFWGDEALTSVNIPGNTVVGCGAFTGTALTNIEIKDGTEFMGNYWNGTFENCKDLEEVQISGSVKLAARMFRDCTKLRTVSLMEGMEIADGEIPKEMFFRCGSLSEFEIPDGVTKIGSNAFAYTGITKVTVCSDWETIGENSFEGCLKLREVTFEEGVTGIPGWMFAKAGTETENGMSVTISDTVTYIGASAFLLSGLTEIAIGSGVEAVGERAFGDCTKLEKITFREGAKIIPAGMFSGTGTGTENGMSVTIPSTVTEIGGSAFSNSGIRSVSIPESVTTVGWAAFNGSALEGSIEIKAGTYANEVFTGCKNLTEVTINPGATMGTDIFKECKSLEKVTLKEGLTAIPSGAFAKCSKLTEVTFPGTLETIGGYAFEETKLTEVTFPDSLTTIEERVFLGCSLQSVTFGSGITTAIGEYAFTNQALYGRVEGYSSWYADRINYTNAAEVEQLKDSTFTLANEWGDGLVKVSDLILKYPSGDVTVQKHNGIYLNPSDFETPSASGKTFLYWADPDGTAVKDNYEYKMPAGGTTLEPVWFDGAGLLIFEPKYYTVIGEEYVSLASGSARINTSAEDDWGWNFGGWTCERDGKIVLYSYGSTFEGSGAVSMTAYFYNPNYIHYTATYDYGGGSGEVSSQTVGEDFSTYYNGYVALPTSDDVHYDGYELVGWKVGDEPIEGPYYQLTSDVTISAVWEPATTITYRSSDGAVIGTEKAVAGQTVKLDDGKDIARARLPLVGWMIEGSDGTVYGLGTDYAVESDVVFVTVWADAPNALVYVTDGGNLVGSTYTPIGGGTAVLDATVEKEGCMFLGWLMEDADGNIVAYANGMSIEASGSIRLTAYLVPDSTDICEVEYDLGGGSGIASQKAVAGQLIALPTSRDVHREGYALTGWEISSAVSERMASLGAEPVGLGAEAITGPYYTVTSESVTISAIWESTAPAPAPEPAWWDDDYEPVVIPRVDTSSSTSEETDKVVLVAVVAAFAASLMAVLVSIDFRRR